MRWIQLWKFVSLLVDTNAEREVCKLSYADWRLYVRIQVQNKYKGNTSSVLTRILPWGVPGPPLLRNRGPVRTLGGQSYKKHAVRGTWARTPNCLLHEVPTWSNMAEEVFTIRRRSLRCSGTCVAPMKVKATKLKTLTHLISCFLFIQTITGCFSVRLTIKTT